MNPVLKKITAVLFVCFLLLSTSAGNAASLTQDSTGALDAALSYLSTQQSADGGIIGLAGSSDPGTTARAMLALAANGIHPSDFTSVDGRSLTDYLSENYPSYVYDENGLLFPGNAGLVLAALSLAETAPQQLIEDLSATLQTDGSFSSEASAEFNSGAVTDLNQAFAIIGFINAKQEVPVSATEYLINRQAADGTWDNGFGPDLDTTAIVVIALIGSEQVSSSDPAIIAALETFRTNQQENGGWKPGWDTDPINVDTTGWITQALITTGEDLDNWKKGENTPLTALLSQQQPDGSIGGSYVNAYSTVEALLGLAQTSIILPVTSAQPGPGTNQNQAGLVIQSAPGQVLQQCISIPDGDFFGSDFLQASGFNLEVSVNPSMGSLVCSIEGTGCPAEDCFCDMPNYWSYWILTDGVWGYAQTGSDTMVVEPGSVQGWSWGDTPPPDVTFDQICGQEESITPTVVIEDNQPTELPQPTQTIQPVEEEITQVEPTQVIDAVENQPAPQETNFLYYVFGGLLVLLIVVIIVLSSRRK
jgi:hypothetical protein